MELSGPIPGAMAGENGRKGAGAFFAKLVCGSSRSASRDFIYAFPLPCDIASVGAQYCEYQRVPLRPVLNVFYSAGCATASAAIWRRRLTGDCLTIPARA